MVGKAPASTKTTRFVDDQGDGVSVEGGGIEDKETHGTVLPMGGLSEVTFEWVVT